jgi:hypothetical protein
VQDNIPLWLDTNRLAIDCDLLALRIYVKAECPNDFAVD